MHTCDHFTKGFIAKSKRRCASTPLIQRSNITFSPKIPETIVFFVILWNKFE